MKWRKFWSLLSLRNRADTVPSYAQCRPALLQPPVSPVNDWLRLTALRDGALLILPIPIPGNWHRERLGDLSRIMKPAGIRAAFNPGPQCSSALCGMPPCSIYTQNRPPVSVCSLMDLNALRDSKYPAGLDQSALSLWLIVYPSKPVKHFSPLSSALHCYLYLLILSLTLWQKCFWHSPQDNNTKSGK